MKMGKVTKNKKVNKLTGEKGKSRDKSIKWFRKPLVMLGFVFLALATSLIISRPAILKGEFNLDYILFKIRGHDEEIANLENKTAETQEQVDQNTAGIENLGNKTDELQAQTTQNTNDIEDVKNQINEPEPEPEPKPEPVDLNTNSWVNYHGTFTWGNLATGAKLGKDSEFNVSWRTCLSVKFILIPSNMSFTVKSKSTTDATMLFNTKDNSSVKYYDASHNIVANCNFTSFEFSGISNDQTNQHWPGNYDIWW